jgi:hypothetical protein
MYFQQFTLELFDYFLGGVLGPFDPYLSTSPLSPVYRRRAQWLAENRPDAARAATSSLLPNGTYVYMDIAIAAPLVMLPADTKAAWQGRPSVGLGLDLGQIRIVNNLEQVPRAREHCGGQEMNARRARRLPCPAGWWGSTS